jgi:predicted regulator of Ras-like GTPase activity (Roadblock/LC7/MglB family)
VTRAPPAAAAPTATTIQKRSTLDADVAIAAELRALRELPDVAGSVLAAVDGLLIATDLHRIEPDTIAAMAAATVGVGRRFTEAVGLGDHRETVIQAEGGCLASYAAGSSALLTVVAAPTANVARLHLFARAAALRIGAVVDSAGSPVPAPAAHAHAQALPAPTPLPQRAPRSGRQSAGRRP